MREFNYVIREALTRGLPPERYVPGGAPYCAQMRNLVPRAYGAETPTPLHLPVDGEGEYVYPQSDIDWPCPVVYHTPYDTIVARETSVTADSVSATALVSGGAWQMACLHRLWALANGTEFLLYTPDDGLRRTPNTMAINAVCAGKGRVLYGGFAVDSWALEATPPGVNAVWWSSIGAGDAAWPCGVTSDILAHWRRNESGFMDMPWPGAVWAMEPLDDWVVVYGANGISALHAETSPISTMGLQDIQGLSAGIGIAGRGAVAGDRDAQVFLAHTGDLWVIQRKEFGLHAERLGYAAYMRQLGLENVVITRDPVRGDYWIAGEYSAYVLTDRGLGGPVNMSPTCLWVDDQGRMAAIARRTGDYDLHEMQVGVVVWPTDVADRGRKHATCLQVSTSGILKRHARVGGKSGAHDVLAPYVAVNPDGVAFVRTSFTDAEVTLRGWASPTGTGLIDRIEVRYQSEDLRYRRGTKGVPGQPINEEAAG